MGPWAGVAASAANKKKSSKIAWMCRVPSQCPLAPRITSVTSVANDKGDMK